MSEDRSAVLRFGGEMHGLWTDAGFSVSYSGGTEVRAVLGSDGTVKASLPPRDLSADVKSASSERYRAGELVSRLNDGTAPALTRAYFDCAARAYFTLDTKERISISGGLDALLPLETLRLLLDERKESWDGAMNILRERFTLKYGGKIPAVPLGALAALQPRDAELVRAVNEKLCSRLWELYPADWRKIGSAAALRDGEIETDFLAASLCGTIICSKEERASRFRTLYAAMPARFQ